MIGPWYQDTLTDQRQILSSRVRLARNIQKYRFWQKISSEDAAQMVQEAQNALNRAGAKLFHQMNVQALGETEQKVFLEKHIVSPEFLKGTRLPTSLLISDDQNISVMLNEEDHIRIQSIQPGDHLAEALAKANQIDDLIEESVEYAFHPEYGYLTACPTNTGTGLRASFMIHLPCLERCDLLKNLLPTISKFGITLRGIYGEGTAPMGSIYQISNQTTLGKSEDDIIQGLQNVTNTVIEKENHAMEKMIASHKDDTENTIYRAYGTLAYSRKITAKEAMDMLSLIRLGYMAGLLEKPKPAKQIYQIMMEIQPGHLMRIAGREMNEGERDIARAKYLRDIFV
ncbi:MAG: protein arginine kinase [Defluviitaleaceae bacterium]|nr:protein arginine kinase [Defluviitaleaceae bacterium]